MILFDGYRQINIQT